MKTATKETDAKTSPMITKTEKPFITPKMIVKTSMDRRHMSENIKNFIILPRFLYIISKRETSSFMRVFSFKDNDLIQEYISHLINEFEIKLYISSYIYFLFKIKIIVITINDKFVNVNPV